VTSLQVAELSKRFEGAAAALDCVNLDIQAGELVVLLGPSGSGKTTLLRCIAGLLRATSGHIVLGDRLMSAPERGIHVPPNRRSLGMVFQNFALWPHMTVYQNVAYPLKAQGKRELLKAGRVEEVLQLVQCSELAGRLPATLSGGQQQRIALARALVAKPDLILFDEPLSSLDALLRIELRAQLREIHRHTGFTGVYVTHDQNEALSLADRIALMSRGRVVQVGTPEQMHTAPATEYAAEFLGMSNRLVFRSDGHNWSMDGSTVDDQDFLPPGFMDREVVVRCRPEQVTLARAGAKAAARKGGRLTIECCRILDRAFYGEFLDYILEVGSDRLKARTSRDSEPLEIGQPVEALIQRGSAIVFEDDQPMVPVSLNPI
jgi:iron(III) transport system ATP-binding protein